jgi:hypothetical protein
MTLNTTNLGASTPLLEGGKSLHIPLKPSPNSVAHRPSSAGPLAHFALAVRRATLSVPA